MTKLEQKHHITQAIAALNRGEPIIIGEYRGHRIDVRNFADVKNPGVKVERVIVTHSFESATGEQMPCVEFLPAGTRADSVKVTYQAGERFICHIAGLKYNGGMKQISLRSFELLSSLGV